MFKRHRCVPTEVAGHIQSCSLRKIWSEFTKTDGLERGETKTLPRLEASMDASLVIPSFLVIVTPKH